MADSPRQLTEADLDSLANLDSRSTPGPWYVDRFDDDHCMSAIALTSGCVDKPDERIAAFLIQAPTYVIHEDGRWAENAELIAMVRNSLPELLRLARVGLSKSG